MTGRFSRGEAAAVFGILLSCCLAFFLLGVYAGRTFFVPKALEPAPALDPAPAAASAAPQDLDFYSGMVASEGDSKTVEPETSDPGEPRRSGEPVRKEASGATSGDPEAVVPAPVDSPPTDPAARFWTVQVGALDKPEEARQVILRLEAKGYSARLVSPTEGGGAFYRVWVGEFEDEAAARRFEERLKGDGFNTYAKKVEEPGRPR